MINVVTKKQTKKKRLTRHIIFLTPWKPLKTTSCLQEHGFHFSFGRQRRRQKDQIHFTATLCGWNWFPLRNSCSKGEQTRGKYLNEIAYRWRQTAWAGEKDAALQPERNNYAQWNEYGSKSFPIWKRMCCFSAKRLLVTKTSIFFFFKKNKNLTCQSFL